MNNVSPRSVLAPLALTQFIASFAGSCMNVSISSIADDLNTTVQGVQIAITMFLLTMAALMIVGSKLTDIWGRKRCLLLGLFIYGIGTVLAAVSQGLPLLIIGYSLFEGVGSALMIPPVYIITTVVFTNIVSRAKSFGTISGMGGVGAAAGPLIGGFITTMYSWRASFLLQTVIIVLIIFLARRITSPENLGERPQFDLLGAILSATGMFFIVFGILQADNNLSLMFLLMLIGAALLFWFFRHIRAKEQKGEDPLLSTAMFHNRVSNLGMATQNIQWLMLMGVSFVVSVYLQVIRGYSAIQTGAIFTAATIGILLSSILQGRLAKRFSQRTLICAGYILTIGGILIFLSMVNITAAPVKFLPGLFIIGFGVGVMLTPSVNVVQSSFPEREQGEISGLSRSVSNLGSSMGTAIAGTVLIATAARFGNGSFGFAMLVLAGFGLLGLWAAFLLPPNPPVIETTAEAA